MLNIGIEKLLERGYEKIIWLDADLLFDDLQTWPWKVAAVLEDSRVCQVFDTAVFQKKYRVRLSSAQYQCMTGEGLRQPRLFPSRRHQGAAGL